MSACARGRTRTHADIAYLEIWLPVSIVVCWYWPEVPGYWYPGTLVKDPDLGTDSGTGRVLDEAHCGYTFFPDFSEKKKIEKLRKYFEKNFEKISTKFVFFSKNGRHFESQMSAIWRHSRTCALTFIHPYIIVNQYLKSKRGYIKMHTWPNSAPRVIMFLRLTKYFK